MWAPRGVSKADGGCFLVTCVYPGCERSLGSTLMSGTHFCMNVTVQDKAFLKGKKVIE